MRKLLFALCTLALLALAIPAHADDGDQNIYSTDSPSVIIASCHEAPLVWESVNPYMNARVTVTCKNNLGNAYKIDEINIVGVELAYNNVNNFSTSTRLGYPNHGSCLDCSTKQVTETDVGIQGSCEYYWGWGYGTLYDGGFPGGQSNFSVLTSPLHRCLP